MENLYLQLIQLHTAKMQDLGSLQTLYRIDTDNLKGKLKESENICKKLESENSALRSLVMSMSKDNENTKSLSIKKLLELYQI